MRSHTLALLLCCAALRAHAAGCELTLSPGADLQAAIDSGPAVLCLAKGRFELSRMLAIGRSHVVLRGQGEATELRLEPGTDSPVIVIGDYRHAEPEGAVRDVSIESLRIVGAGDSPHEFMPAFAYLMNSAVAVRGGRDIRLQGLKVQNCRSACLLAERGTRALVLQGNSVSGARFDGISLNDTVQATIAGNTSTGNRAAGLTAEHLDDSRIHDNQFSGNGSDGIYLSNSHGNHVSGNRFDGNGLSGVFLTCAVIQHSFPARCYGGSMSWGNVFQDNRFSANRYAYYAAPNFAADCSGPAARRNRSQRDERGGSPDHEALAWWFGPCIDVDAPRP